MNLLSRDIEDHPRLRGEGLISVDKLQEVTDRQARDTPTEVGKMLNDIL